MALRRQPPHHRITLVSACVFDTAPTSRAAGTSLVVRTNCTGNFPILLHDSTSSSRRSAPPEWWTSPARTAPWPWSSSLRESDASGFSVGPRTGSAVCSGHACRLALPGTSPPQHAVTASSPRRCTFGCSSGGLCRSGYTGRTSAGTSANRTSEDDGFFPPHTLHACFWRGAAYRCTSRSTASEPRTQARRARWAPQWLLGALRLPGRAFRPSGVILHSHPTSFQSPPDPLKLLSPVTTLDTTALLVRATTTTTMVSDAASNSTSIRIHADLDDRPQAQAVG